MVNLHGMLECQLCCELLFLLNMAHMGCHLCGRLLSEQCLLVCSYVFI